MFKMCTLKWSEPGSARHNGTNVSSTTEKPGPSGIRRKDLRIWKVVMDVLSRRTLTHVTSPPSSCTTCTEDAGAAEEALVLAPTTLHHVLVLISIQTSSLITIMTFSSSAIDLWLEHRPS